MAPDHDAELGLEGVQTEPMAGGIAFDGGTPWRDEAVVRNLYYGERMSMSEVADELGCAVSTLHKWMGRHGIERRDQYDEAVRAVRSRPVMFETDRQGYEQWRGETCDGTFRVSVHRLLAVAENGVDAVADNIVHHRNGIRWDNRPSNLETMSREEHNRLHHARGDFDEAMEHLVPGGPRGDD